MKNKSVISGLIGAGFFAVGSLGLGVGVLPSLAIGAASFAASELVLSSSKKIEEKTELSFKDRINEAKKDNNYLKEMVSKIEDEEISKDLDEITKSSTKIINRIEESHLENKTANKFMDYYLPVCVKIVGRYDEIENQSLTSRDSKKFMQDGAKLLKATNRAFRKILNSLYQSDIIDADAEMKVFNGMLTSDGYSEELMDEEASIDE